MIFAEAECHEADINGALRGLEVDYDDFAFSCIPGLRVASRASSNADIRWHSHYTPKFRMRVFDLISGDVHRFVAEYGG